MMAMATMLDPFDHHDDKGSGDENDGKVEMI